MNCTTCNEPLINYLEEGTTLLGRIGILPPGHEHDVNCISRTYVCSNGHKRRLSKRNKCPKCDWVQKETCFCHPDPKLNEWPENSKCIESY